MKSIAVVRLLSFSAKTFAALALIPLAGCVALVFIGCQTRLTAEKFPEVAHPIQAKVTTNGVDAVITTGYLVTSGGWCATARSPLWAREELRGLNLGVATNGMVYLMLDSYDRDLSTNAVMMTKTIFDGSANLAAAVAKAYAAISTGGGSEAASSVVSKVVSYFKAKGGDPAKSTVTAEGDKLTVTDGTTCISCDAAGNCSDCVHAP
jgi:hypothetical protein